MCAPVACLRGVRLSRRSPWVCCSWEGLLLSLRSSPSSAYCLLPLLTRLHSLTLPACSMAAQELTQFVKKTAKVSFMLPKKQKEQEETEDKVCADSAVHSVPHARLERES